MKRLTRILIIIAILIPVIGTYRGLTMEKPAKDTAPTRQSAQTYTQPSPEETIREMDEEKVCKQEITKLVQKVSQWRRGQWNKFGNGNRRVYKGQFTFVDMKYTARTDRYTCVFDDEFGNDFVIGNG